MAVPDRTRLIGPLVFLPLSPVPQSLYAQNAGEWGKFSPFSNTCGEEERASPRKLPVRPCVQASPWPRWRHRGQCDVGKRRKLATEGESRRTKKEKAPKGLFSFSDEGLRQVSRFPRTRSRRRRRSRRDPSRRPRPPAWQRPRQCPPKRPERPQGRPASHRRKEPRTRRSRSCP